MNPYPLSYRLFPAFFFLAILCFVHFSCTKHENTIQKTNNNTLYGHTTAPKSGCTQVNAWNYDPTAAVDNGTCDFSAVNNFIGSFTVYVLGEGGYGTDTSGHYYTYYYPMHDTCNFTSVEVNGIVNLTGILCNYGAVIPCSVQRNGNSYIFNGGSNPSWNVSIISRDSLNINWNYNGGPGNSEGFYGIAVRKK